MLMKRKRIDKGKVAGKRSMNICKFYGQKKNWINIWFTFCCSSDFWEINGRKLTTFIPLNLQFSPFRVLFWHPLLIHLLIYYIVADLSCDVAQGFLWNKGSCYEKCCSVMMSLEFSSIKHKLFCSEWT